MDVAVTTRMDGMVLVLKNGMPAIALDPQGVARFSVKLRPLGGCPRSPSMP
jgi:hypothetical protein